VVYSDILGHVFIHAFLDEILGVEDLKQTLAVGTHVVDQNIFVGHLEHHNVGIALQILVLEHLEFSLLAETHAPDVAESEAELEALLVLLEPGVVEQQEMLVVVVVHEKFLVHAKNLEQFRIVLIELVFLVHQLADLGQSYVQVVVLPQKHRVKGLEHETEHLHVVLNVLDVDLVVDRILGVDPENHIGVL